MLEGLVADEMRQRDKKRNNRDVSFFLPARSLHSLDGIIHDTGFTFSRGCLLIFRSHPQGRSHPAEFCHLVSPDGEAALPAEPRGRGAASFPPCPCTPRGDSALGSSPRAGPSLAAATSRGTHAPSRRYPPNLPFCRPSLGWPCPLVPLTTWQRRAFASIGGKKNRGEVWLFPGHATPSVLLVQPQGTWVHSPAQPSCLTPASRQCLWWDPPRLSSPEPPSATGLPVPCPVPKQCQLADIPQRSTSTSPSQIFPLGALSASQEW